jgi:hypothetical protein
MSSQDQRQCWSDRTIDRKRKRLLKTATPILANLMIQPTNMNKPSVDILVDQSLRAAEALINKIDALHPKPRVS